MSGGNISSHLAREETRRRQLAALQRQIDQGSPVIRQMNDYGGGAVEPA